MEPTLVGTADRAPKELGKDDNSVGSKVLQRDAISLFGLAEQQIEWAALSSVRASKQASILFWKASSPAGMMLCGGPCTLKNTCVGTALAPDHLDGWSLEDGTNLSRA